MYVHFALQRIMIRIIEYLFSFFFYRKLLVLYNLQGGKLAIFFFCMKFSYIKSRSPSRSSIIYHPKIGRTIERVGYSRDDFRSQLNFFTKLFFITCSAPRGKVGDYFFASNFSRIWISKSIVQHYRPKIER